MSDLKRQSKRASKLITEHQKHDIATIQTIARMLERGDCPTDIHTYFYAMGWEFLEEIYLMARFMIVLDEAQQN